jgi:hypothetical protein
MKTQLSRLGCHRCSGFGNSVRKRSSQLQAWELPLKGTRVNVTRTASKELAWCALKLCFQMRVHKSNENKISHRWRERARFAMEAGKSCKSYASARPAVG